MKGRKTALYIIFLVVLLLPLLQKVTHLIPEKPLTGSFVPHEKPALTAKTWFEGSFQSDYDQYINENLGFHNSLVRLHNRFCFKLFHKINAANVVLGEEEYLFEQDYIDAHYGMDFVGLDSILYKVKETRRLQDSLAARGKILVVFLAPSKADFFPEYISKAQRKDKTDNTNYLQYSRLLKQFGVNVIDYNAYYQTIKFTAKHPLYPKYGIHWSQYGMLQATDSLTSYIAQKSGLKLPRIIMDSYNITLDPQSSDCDLGELLNISSTPLRSDSLCYPAWHWSTDTAFSKPTLTVIADSYYWQIFNIGYQANCFQGSFWYYNSSVYPECYTKETLTKDLDMKEEIEKSDVILIMSTTPGLKNFSWGAVENLLKAL
ncbi:MAG: hypothetical protein K6A41_05050 [Bacteroidales bacterium]|nr:hypothetical protein [Bacteroidales bacterium]